jgi:NAD-specific glutamate dehydrogenase
MPFIAKRKVKIPTEDKTRTKILTIAIEEKCLEEVKNLMATYDKMYLKYRHDPLSCSRLAENFLQELSNINLKLVAWLFDDNNEVKVNNKVVLKLVDDGK